MNPRPLPRESVALMQGYHSPQLEVEVRLNANESPEPPPAEFRAAVAEAVDRVAWHRYPDRSATRLRTRIGELHEVGPEQVFAANGSNEVLQTLLLAYGGAGRTAAVFEPTYALHAHLGRVTGTSVVTGERGPAFALDIDEARRVVQSHRPDVTFLCSPNNPTGAIDDPAKVSEVLGLVRGVGGLLCVDEAYGQFNEASALSLLGDEAPLVVTRTYSKTWAMAGARLGYLVGPEWLVSELSKVVLPYHLDAMTQIAGAVALDYVDSMQQRVQRLVAERERLVAELAMTPVEVWPSGANFVLIRPEEVSGEVVWQKLVDRSVLVRNCASWPRLEGCLRVTVGAPRENDRFLEALREVLT
ncbi:MAG: histidinol-phosphate transaminase [Acidimicrobiaceae bacterium]|nr:histidinol-phosphate transaminase [Acidimicrobiaceae bacterium]